MNIVHELLFVSLDCLDGFACELSVVDSGEQFAELSVQFSQALNGIGGDLIVEPFALDEAGQFIEFAERDRRSEEHTSELQSLMRISYAVLCLKTKKITPT